MPRRRRNKETGELEWPDGAAPEQRDTAPKRASAPRGSKARDISLVIGAVNDVVLALAPEDALSDDEAKLLVHGVDSYQRSDARVAAWLAKAAGASGKLVLLYAVTVIALPRLARHKLIPSFIAERFQARASEMAATFDGQQAERPTSDIGDETLYGDNVVASPYARNGFAYPAAVTE